MTKYKYGGGFVILNLQRGRFRPIRLGPALAGTDIQGALPLWWCDSCGSEVFLPGARCCIKCRIAKTERSHYAEPNKSVPGLHPGKTSR